MSFSQSYHTGIETATVEVFDIIFSTHNRTTLELKPNHHRINQIKLNSQSHHIGIETLGTDSRFLFLQCSQSYHTGIETVKFSLQILNVVSHNRTTLELKLVAEIEICKR